MPNIRFIDSGTPVGAYGIPKVDNATSSSFATTAISASFATTASHALFAVSASVEITKEVSSSHANRADVADSGNGIFSGSFSGSYEGNGSGLTNIPASGIVGLNLSQIADGTATASISETNGFIVNTDSKITGSLDVTGTGTILDDTAIGIAAASARLHVKGAGTTSATTTFLVERSNGNDIFRISDDRSIALLGASTFYNGIEIDTGDISGSATSTASFGTYLGDGSQLSGITPTAGSSAGRVVFTTTNGELTAESGFEYDSATDQLTVQSLNVVHLTSSFITASTIQTSGSNIFGDDTTDTQTLIGTTIMTGSAQVTGSVNITSGSLKIRGTTAATGASLFEIRSSAADAYDDLYTFDDNGKVTHEVSGAGDKYVIQTTSGAPMFKFGVSAGSQGYLKIQNNDFTGAYLSHQGGAFGYGATIPSSGTSLLVKGNAQITGSLSLSGSQDIKDGNLTISGSSNYSIIITGSSTQNATNGSEIAIVDTTRHTTSSNSYGPKITLKAAPDDSTYGNITTINAISTTSGGADSPPRTVINSNRPLFYNNTTTDYSGFALRIRNNTSPSNRNVEHRFHLSGQGGGYAHIARSQMGTGRIFLHGLASSGIYGMMLKASKDDYLIIGPQTSGTDGAEVVRITPTAFKVTGNTEITGDITSITEITASGNISSSATSTASFGTYLGDGSQLTGIIPPFGKFGIANASGEYTYYSDLSSSLQAATAGDTIQLFTNHTESSDHVFHLKDKVDFNFNGNELFISASATLDGADMFSDNDIAVSCSFYNGRIRFTQAIASGIFNRLLYIDNAASEITNIGFEWEVENGHNASPFYPIRNDGTLIGGKFIGGSALSNYLIQTYGTLKHLDVYARTGILFNGYLKKHYNLNVHTYGGQAAAEATNTYVYDSYFHAETGQALSAFYAINCIVIADNGAGITGTRRLINSTIRNANGIGVSLNGEMIGGSVYTENNISVAAAASEVLGVSIYNRDYIGPGVTVSNGEISNCAIIDDYPYSGQKSIEVDSGATTATITNCSFDFLNNSTNNIAITADDDNTPVFFANNTFKNCTPTNPTKVTQAILNTPDAQGNIVINN